MPDLQPSDDRAPSQPAAPAGSIWLSNPWVDLIVGCGLWSLPLLAASYAIEQDATRQWSVAFYALALVCNYPHFMATVYRAYGPADRGRHTFYTVYVTGLIGLAGVAALVDLRLVPWMFTAYIFWSPWHYTGQNFGLLMMFLRRAGAPVTDDQRRRLRVAFVASFIMLLASINEGASPDPFVLSLGLHIGVAWPIQVAAGLVFVSLAVPLAWTWVRTLPLREAAAPLTLITTQALWFVFPLVVSWTAAMAVPQTRYSSGILAVMHSAQYLWVTQHFTRRDQRDWNPWRYWAVLVIGGIALFVPLPWIASRGLHADFTQSFLVVTAVVNIHHFVIDGVVWKLRQSRVADVLIGNGPSTGAAATSASPAVPAWATVRRLAASVAAAALLGVAALDQWRYWLVARAGRDALERAAALNPYDQQVQVRLLRTLLEEQRIDEARALLDRALATNPRNVDALVNRGVLASRAGDLETARESWARALAEQEAQPQVHLYLAELLHAQNVADEAAGHYRRYLELVVQQRSETPPDPRAVVPVVLRFGDALAEAGRPEEARQQHELALRMATQTGLTDMADQARTRLDHHANPPAGPLQPSRQ